MATHTLKTDLLTKLETRQAHCAVIGLGYVGLPLAVELAETGYTVIGLDVNTDKVLQINRGESYISDVPSARLKPLVESGQLCATSDYNELRHVDSINICVPTPLSKKTRDPDMSYIQSAITEIAKIAHAGMLIILESTTYPGTTNEVILPHLTGFTVGEEIFVAFSGERIDPGNTRFHIRNTPKVVGGVTPACTEVAVALYQGAIDQLVPVSSPTTAEMVKLVENTFRLVNIGLANETAIMCDYLGIDVWEVIQAAATKPFGFMPFYPGPGPGGHCIPIDPLYLSWKMKTLNYNARFIELASDINTGMPHYVVGRIADALNDDSKAVRGARIVLLGVAYKRDIDDVRESPALEIIHILQGKGAHVQFHDPHVASIRLEDGEQMHSTDYSAELLASADCVAIITDHSTYDWADVVQHSRVILDTRHVLDATGTAYNRNAPAEAAPHNGTSGARVISL
ncbi:MAG: nucleotide sugar dehydrogenase [Anaerolineae bacterium]